MKSNYSTLATALNNAQSNLGSMELIIDLATATNSVNGVPEWVQLLNNDETVKGRDGREWVNDAPEAIVAFFKHNIATGLKLVFDWEHATEHKAPKGEDAPAAAWGTDIEIRNDREIWVRLDWTDRGRWSVEGREYRYISPVLLYVKETLQIRGIKSVGLTNNPNLTIAALNHQSKIEPEGEHTMTLLQALCQALGLPEGSTEAAVIAKASSMGTDLATALNSAKNPPLDQFVPKGDYDNVLATANNAQQELATIKKETLDSKIKTAIDSALKDKKISPSTVEYHTANCQQEGGLARFEDFAKSAPEVLGGAGDLDNKKTDEGEETALNSQQQAMADNFGNSAEDLAKYG